MTGCGNIAGIRDNMKKLALVLGLFFAVLSARADVTLNGMFTSHMVLQRDIPVPVFGSAEAGEQVTVSFGGQSKSVAADQDGKWLVTLPVARASKNPVTMTVAGKNKIVLDDIVVGDVWVCSGQSNMEFMLGQCKRPEDVNTADFPLIRQYFIAKTKSAQPCDEVKSNWVVCSPQSAGAFTALGFHFARRVLAETGVPIGLISTSFGGTPIEPWISPSGKEAVPESAQNPVKISFAASDWHCLYNAMIHPLLKFPIKGVLWYQGESNVLFNKDDNREETYFQKMRALVIGWRKDWGIGDFPFYYIQLASLEKPNNKPEGGDGWAMVWMAQLRALALPNTGMASAVDLSDPGNPNDIHPKNKKDLGERLAAWALVKDYGKKLPAYCGPLYKSMQIDGSRIRISFESTGSGLMVATKKGYDPVMKDPQGKLKRFAIAGEDKKWVWADAEIDGKTVVVSSPSVPKPVAVRYAFSMNPEGCNLYNQEGYPASPFRTDHW